MPLWVLPIIYITGFSTETGNFELTVTCTPPPVNDNCVDAISVLTNSSTAFSNVGADFCNAPGPDEPSACTFFSYSQVGSDIWYSWTADINCPVTVSLCGSGFDTKLAIYDGTSGCPSTESAIACNDDLCGLQSQLTFTPVSGTTYLIRVGGFNGAQGTGTLAVSYSDVTAPVIVNCPADVNENVDPGTCGRDVTIPVPVFGTDYTDACGATIINDYNGTDDASDNYPLGVTTVTWTATDLAGNFVTCTQTVTITDNEGPVITCSPLLLFDNGPLVNSPGTGFGGADESILQNSSLGMGTLGFGHQLLAGYRVADDFTITNPNGWTIDQIAFYAYQTGSSTTSTITAVNLRIWDGVPGVGTVVWGDGSTNLLALTEWSGIYRVTETTSGATTRPIMKNTVDLGGVTLPAGTYWLDWQTDGTLASGPWAPPVTITGSSTTGDGMQSLDGGVSYAAVTDVGGQGFPFLILGNQTLENDPGICGALVTIESPLVLAECSLPVTVINDFNGTSDASDTYPVGTTTVEWTVTDAEGNSTTCSFDVVVEDTENPTIDCVTSPLVCNTFVSTDVPVQIDNGTNPVISSITVGTSGIINDINLLGLNITHTWIGDVDITLTSPGGTTINVLQDLCDFGDANLLLNFDDAGAAYGSIPCPPTDGGTYQPLNALSAFNGENMSGIWTLTISDDFLGLDGGTLNAWSLEICSGGDNNIFASADPGVCEASVTVPQPAFDDNCLGATIVNNFNGTDDASGTYQVGTTTVLWTVTDAALNVATCTMEVTVSDDEAPQITCPGDISVVNDPGVCGATVTFADPVFTDNCAFPLLTGFSGSSIDILDNSTNSGTQTVSGLTGTSLGTDVFLNSVCLDVTHTWVGDLQFVLESPSGNLITLMDQPACSGDNLDVCFVPGIGNALVGGTCSNLPAYSGSFTAEGGDLANFDSGNDPNGTWTLYVYDWFTGDFGTIDNWTLTFEDASGTVTATQTAGLPGGSTFPVGTTTNTFEITDGAGNTATCSFDVIVSDTEGPVFSICADITQDNDAGLCSAVVNYTAPVGGGIIEQFGDAFENGRVSNTAWNGTGGTSADDIFIPAGGCVDFTNVSASFFNNNPGTVTSMIVTFYADASGVPGAVVATQTLSPGDWTVTPIGSNFGLTVNRFDMTFTSPINLCGGVSGTTYWMSIVGSGVAGNDFYWELSTTQPYGNNGQFYNPANGFWQIVPPGDNFVFSLSTLTPNVIDNCGGIVFVTQTDTSGLTSGDVFPVGTTYQEYTATDQYGNSTVCSFTVTVNDVEVPTIDCGSTPSTLDCNIYASTNVPVNILDVNTVTSTLTVSGTSNTISDVNVLNLTGTHSWVGDLTVSLTSPGGTTVILWQTSCSSTDNFNFNFDDAGSTYGSWACTAPLGGGGTYHPNQALSVFNGETANGTWILTITDGAGGDVGALNSWSLDICTGLPGAPMSYNQSNDLGMCGAVVTIAQPTYSDNCTVIFTNDYNGTDDATDYYPVGTTTVTWTVTDPSGNTASCSVEVTVTDDEDPVITNCPGDIFVNNDLGQCGAIVSWDAIEAIDNCPLPAIVQFSDNSGLAIPDSDPSGTSASQTVSVTGTQLGTDVILQSVCLDVTHTWVGDLQFVLESPNGDQILLMDEPGCSGDNLDVCFVPGTGNPLVGGTCSSNPAYSGNFTAEGGDLASFSAGTDPNGTWTLYAIDWAGGDVGTVNNWTLTFVDSNGVPAPIQIAGLPNGSEFPVGTTTNTFQVTDASGNTATCSFDVVVSDTEAPVIDCPGDIEVDNDPGVCGAVVSYNVPVGGGTYNQVGNSFENGRVSNTDWPGISADDFTLTSSSGNCFDFTQVTANFFTNTLSSLSAVNLFIYDDAGGIPGSLVNSIVLSPSDWTATVVGSNFGFSVYHFVFTLPSPLTLCGSPAGTTYWIGIQGVGVTYNNFYWELSATTPYGNNGVFNDNGSGWVSYGDNFVFSISTEGTPNVPDNCPGFIVVTQIDGSGYTSGDLFPIGITQQQYTAEDQYGNIDTCTFNITVTDAETPVFTVCSSDIIGCENDEFTDFATPEASDNCNVDSIVQIAGLPSGSDFPVGVTTNTFVAYDPAGNTDTCSFTITITPSPVADFTFFPTCIGEIIYFTSDASVDPSLGTSLASYEWEFSDGSGINTDVNPTHVYNVAGDYDVTLTVTTNWGCEYTITHTVTVHPTPVMTLTAEDALCNGDANGSITVDVTVGDDPIEYSINGGPAQVDSVFSGLPAGTYLISITDANGCSVSGSVTVGEPEVLVAAVDSTLDALCFGQASGAAAVSATGGTEPYSYSIDGGASQSSGLFSGLTGGTHVATVTDDNGCTAIVSVTIGEPEEILVDATSTPVLCYGDSTGSIEVTASGGTGVFTYSADGGANFQSSGLFNGLPADSYVVVVQDENGCSVSEGVNITQPDTSLSATADVQNVACTGDASGSVVVTATGGTGAMQYSIDGGESWQSSNVFSDLDAGDYTIDVVDANGCTTSVDVSVTEPAELLTLSAEVTQVSCNGEGDGMIDVTATGGDAPYEYSFNGGITWQSSGSFTNLAPGTYTVMVRDTNGCQVATIVVVTQPNVLAVSQTGSSNSSCEGQENGSFTVEASGGTGPYTYASGGNSNSTGVFSSVSSGIHLVTVTDASGCTATVEAEVGYNTPLPVAAFNWFASGSVVQFSNQSTNGTTYSWDFGDGSTSTDQNPVHTYAAEGTYTVTLIATNACGSDTVTWIIDTNNIGINDPNADGHVLNIYPNPNHGVFTLTYTGTGIIGEIQVNVMTIEGKLLMAEQFTVNEETFVRNYSDIELAAGVYIVQFISENSSEVKRITVDR